MTLLRYMHSCRSSPMLLFSLAGLWSLAYCTLQTLRKHTRHLLARSVMLGFLIVTGHVWTSSALAIERLRVGVYNYSPLVFVDEQKQAKGLFVDVLDFIARQENWTLEYLPGTWPENLARLENGEIDLLVNIAHTAERAKKFDFSEQHLFLDWGMVYRRQGAKIDTIFDLRNKRVAVLKGSFYAGELKKLLDQFAIKVQFVEKSEFSAVFTAIEAGEVDAGANASLAGLKLPESSPIQSTSIVYAPTKLQFAVRKDSHQALLAKLDQHVAALHADKSSVYHESREKWFGQIHQATAMPAWVWWTIGSLIIGLSLLIGLSMFLDRLVRRKTSDLRASEESLAITLHSIGDGVIATDAAGRVTRMNATAERLTGWTLAEAAGRPMVEVFRIVNASTHEAVADPVQRVMASGDTVGLANHTALLARDGREYQIADSAAPIRDAAGHIVGAVLVFSDVTAKYQAEQILHLTRFTVEAAAESLFWITPDARIVDVNAAACSALGYTREELLQLRVPDVDAHYNAELWPHHFAELRQRGSLTFESEQRTKDGRLFPVEIVANYVKHGSEERNCAFVRDITERKQADAALIASQARWRFAIEGAGDGLWDWNIQSGKTFYSPRYKTMLGYSEDEIGDSAEEWSKRIHPEDAPGAFAALQPYMEGKAGSAQVEFRMLCKDGRWQWTLGRGMVMARDADGKPLRMIGTNSDITERKQAESQLRLAASVFTHAREGITITDMASNILDVNEAFTRITGYSRAEAIGQTPRILQSGRHDRSFYAAMWDALTGQGHWSGDVWNRRKDGAVYVEKLTISAVKDAAGTVQHYLALFSDISAVKEHQSLLEHIAHFDALTNLPNRLLLADRLQQAMAQVQRRGQQLAVAYIDLDGFKAINDRHGHEAGDEVLVALASRMKDCLREGDTLARLGGDEFVAVLIDLAEPEASVPLLSRLLAAAALPVLTGELSLQVSASLGVTFYPQAHDIEAGQLLRQADQAMYQAKLAGKSRYHVFDAVQDSSIRVQHESLERIRLALAQGEFVLHYQPKVNMRNGTVIGAEALIRWQHPEKGLLAPAMFLPVFEEHPLAVNVGEWVIDAALHQIETWRAAGLDLPVSVNIGARQLQQADFVARLQAIQARRPHLRPDCIELEILETSALTDMAQVSQVIADCAKLGVKFALDDFGTGYSSLTYLKQLRVAQLKIDQSFVRGMLADPDDLALMQGVISLAAVFKREVIAEGVETVAHGSALLQLGCELAQGYGIARPMPPDQLPAWVATWQPDAAWCGVMNSGEASRPTYN